MELRIHETVRFIGMVTRLRTDTADGSLGFDARRVPRRDLTEAVTGSFAHQSVTGILTSIVESLDHSPVTCEEDLFPGPEVERLEFVNMGLFYAVDLLARLGGNYLWDLDWNNRIRFDPPTDRPQHVVYFDPREHRFRFWENAATVRNYFLFHGGIVNGNEFRREFADEESIGRLGLRRDSLFARPVTTEQPFLLLRQAVLEELPRPGLEKSLDFRQGAIQVRAGDRVEVRESGLPELGRGNVFRVREVEHQIGREGDLFTRLHLARGLESASRYQFYIDHDPNEDPSRFVERRVGAFRLDFSSLDSAAHLDT